MSSLKQTMMVTYLELCLGRSKEVIGEYAPHELVGALKELTADMVARVQGAGEHISQQAKECHTAEQGE